MNVWSIVRSLTAMFVRRLNVNSVLFCVRRADLVLAKEDDSAFVHCFRTRGTWHAVNDGELAEKVPFVENGK